MGVKAITQSTFKLGAKILSFIVFPGGVHAWKFTIWTRQFVYGFVCMQNYENVTFSQFHFDEENLQNC